PLAGSDQTPSSSGPRWRSVAAMFSANSSSFRPEKWRDGLTNPAIPHIRKGAQRTGPERRTEAFDCQEWPSEDPEEPGPMFSGWRCLQILSCPRITKEDNRGLVQK